ncbi:hypothetical protein BDN70DRAFT_919454 [Pholiota conissans]|uniref:Manganese/iron superoxide dismutase C-terminal domain-containing protein n=1 Tax=Pholiota conissans TaxID=109636 RepID=A0A9P5Z6P8_9AGAR|nr:hypothetical protein BDN70DRAFT_919454 [Pholiota conissans]
MASCLRLVTPAASRSSAIKLTSFRTSKWATRSMHRARGLPYDIEKGLGNFLPPPALKTFVEYQEGLLERLNHELRTDPTQERHSSVAQIAINYSAKRDRTLAFNYAVLALNNSFFLDQLSPLTDSTKPNHEHNISGNLFRQIENNYGDLTHLKSTFSAAAMGIFSSGWVWLVSDKVGNLAVLPTIGPSTLLVRSRRNMHYDPTQPILGEDSGRHAVAAAKPLLPPSPTSPASGVGSGRPGFKPFEFQSRTLYTTPSLLVESPPRANNIFSEPNDNVVDEIQAPPASKDMLLAGRTMFPLFVVPVYEHAWMSAGYGIWGKEAWLREFWTALDWQKVSNAYNRHLSSVIV